VTELLAGGPGTLLVLSPHLDDAALSCGASIARAVDGGWRVVVLVFFAGLPPDAALTPAAREYHEMCGLGDDAIAARIREDEAAASVLSAESRRLDLLECLYRLGPDGTPRYASWADISDPPGGPEPEIVDAVTGGLADALASYRPDVVLHPLAVGGHVDHLAVRAGALRLQAAAAGPAWFGYEDVPYVMFPWHAGWETTVAEGLHPTAHGVDEQQWARKLDAIACYPSQITAMFGQPSDWRTYLTTYARGLSPDGRDTPTERFWRRPT
jgi:LmbE family N-acetylglucosaminyl deacetylase